MRTSLESLDPTTVRVTVVVEPEELQPAIDRTARRLAHEVRVPGFRKGKVPRPVLEARLGRDTLVHEAIEREAVPEFYAKAIEELGVEPLNRARVEPPSYEAGKPLEFSATVEVKPRIDLPPTRGVRVERPRIEVTDEHVNAQLERMRERMARLEVVGRPLRQGDFAQIDIRATRHMGEIPELTRTDLLYEVGSGTIVPELDKELEGKRPGDILQFNATLPERAGEGLAGQEVTFHLIVKEAKAKVLPDLDDEFAQEASEFDTLDELRAEIRESLERAAAEQERNELEVRVLEAYLSQVEVPLPPSLVEQELSYRANRFMQNLAALKLPLDTYLEQSGTSREQLEADLRAQAERAVRAQLVLEAVAEAEGLEVSDEELDAEVRRQAERAGRTPEQLRRALGEGVSVIRGDILRSKALSFLVEHADVVEPVEGAERTAGSAAASEESQTSE